MSEGPALFLISVLKICQKTMKLSGGQGVSAAAPPHSKQDDKEDPEGYCAPHSSPASDTATWRLGVGMEANETES